MIHNKICKNIGRYKTGTRKEETLKKVNALAQCDRQKIKQSNEEMEKTK